MTEEHPPKAKGNTDNEKLRELIEEWREQAELCSDDGRGPLHGSKYGNGISAGLNHAADELEQVLENE
jgi:hypothetical protein